MRYFELNEAVDIEKTYAQMGLKLMARYYEEYPDKSQEDADRENDEYAGMFGGRDIARVTPKRSEEQQHKENHQIATGFIKGAMDADPSPNDKYTLWILRTYIKGGIQRFEDFVDIFTVDLDHPEGSDSRVGRALRLFDTNKQRMEIKDINQIKSLSQLEDLVEPFKDMDQRSGKQKKKAVSNKIKQETEVIYKDELGTILIPKTEEASCFWGQGTRWCTASTDSHNYFEHYTSSGSPLYILLLNNGRKLQLHFKSGQFMDEKDLDIEPNTDEAKAVNWAINSIPGIRSELMDTSYRYVQYLDNATDLELIHYLNRAASSDILEHIPHVSDKVLQSAFLHTRDLLFYKKDLSDDMKLAIIKRTPDNIRQIKNPPNELVMAAVSTSGIVIQFIKRPTPEQQKAAIENNLLAFSKIVKDERDERIGQWAVDKYGARGLNEAIALDEPVPKEWHIKAMKDDPLEYFSIIINQMYEYADSSYRKPAPVEFDEHMHEDIMAKIIETDDSGTITDTQLNRLIMNYPKIFKNESTQLAAFDIMTDGKGLEKVGFSITGEKGSMFRSDNAPKVINVDLLSLIPRFFDRGLFKSVPGVSKKMKDEIKKIRKLINDTPKDPSDPIIIQKPKFMKSSYLDSVFKEYYAEWYDIANDYARVINKMEDGHAKAIEQNKNLIMAIMNGITA